MADLAVTWHVNPTRTNTRSINFFMHATIFDKCAKRFDLTNATVNCVPKYDEHWFYR